MTQQTEKRKMAEKRRWNTAFFLFATEPVNFLV